MAVFNPTSRAVEYRELYGLPMGNSSSPVQFCRIPEALPAVTQVVYVVPVAPFVDDYMMLDHGDEITVTRSSPSTGAPGVLAAKWLRNQIHRFGGMEFSPEKHQESDQRNKSLGVSVDLTVFRTTSTIHFTPTSER